MQITLKCTNAYNRGKVYQNADANSVERCPASCIATYVLTAHLDIFALNLWSDGEDDGGDEELCQGGEQYGIFDSFLDRCAADRLALSDASHSERRSHGGFRDVAT